ncbi:MAG: HAMP domain-containing histidine kinase [Bacteroides sp.]|nr:HAMP domain-containing histidine kinase [Bacteroides sp.]MCI1681527.1 HAMP domain-containing histidine kinase [Bacteroides sp.]
MTANKRIILLLPLLLFGFFSALSSDKRQEDKHIQLVEQLMNNNLLFSSKIQQNEILQLEDSFVKLYERKKEYERMFLMKQMAIYALVSQGHITEGFEKGNKMLKQAQHRNNNMGIAISHLAIGDTYLSANMNEEAAEEYEKAMQLLSQISNSEKIQERVLIHLIPTLIEQGKTKETKKYLNKVTNAFKDKQHNRFILCIYQAYYYIHTDNTNEALKYITYAEEWYKIYPFLFYNVILKHIQGEYAQKTRNYKQAIKIYNELIGISSNNITHNCYLKLESALADLYTKSGDIAKACNAYKDISSARDSIDAHNYSSQVNLLRTVYQADHLEVSNQNQRSRLLFYLIVGNILILTIIIVSVIHSRDINKELAKSNIKLSQARQALENSIQSKSLFLSNMSHEIRTPLNALSGFSSILTDTHIDKETREQCNDIILQNSELLLKLIDDVVDLSNIDTGKMQFYFSHYDAVNICRNVIDTIQKIKQTQASVILQTSLNKLDLYTDESRLQQLLFNLLINATKFTSEGSIILSLEIDSDNSNAIFSVTDTGCGIDPQKRKNIFNRFEKLNEGIQGSGLGLAISQLIVERFGGKIWIDPQYNSGSRFVFTHPIRVEKRKEAL